MILATVGNFFGPNSLIILLVVVLLFGAKKLPELAKGLGQAIREFSNAKDGSDAQDSEPPKQIS